ncbi:DUF3055 domain-containing protein [Bacillus sp. FJAT-45350]|uniref:DUF3055 domain-containing protein n=1 Tax=Bacillus sp. FJAT-45350 TaxID=2011014 RepID=UPI000BB93639|nr:DUF3055 domain-containing protein [Bacillus sp. FJAT-45350]
MYEKLYAEHEEVNMHHVGFISNDKRYDFAIVFTTLFFGKTLVVCIQSGRSALLDSEDIHEPEKLCSLLGVCSQEEVEKVTAFLLENIPDMPFKSQY